MSPAIKTRKDPTVAPLEGGELVIRLRKGEPYFLLRAQDVCSIRTVKSYASELRHQIDRLSLIKRPLSDVDETCERLESLARDVDAMVDYFTAWQNNHPELVKLPD